MTTHRFTYNATEVIPYIDWNYFFHAWSIGHRSHKTQTALQLKEEAIALTREMNPVVTSLFRLCEARSNGDSIELEDTTLPLLRQQHSRAGEPTLCLSDFVSPNSDKVALFATAVSPEFEKERSEEDPYRSMLIQTIADRLAEAATSLMHKTVRTSKEYWGYSPDEKLSIEQLNIEKYQGIRPAVGYPSLPDQSVIFIIDKLLNLKEAGIELTESGAMIPHASVCGIMLSHPAAHYFAVGNICDEQLIDYSHRRGISSVELRKYLVKNIG